MSRLIGALFAAVTALAISVGPTLAQEPLKGDLMIHDPTWVEVDGVQIAFGTGREQSRDRGAIRVKTSADGIVWDDKGTIGQGVPDWVEPVLGLVPPNIWAPHAFPRDGKIYLYYSVSTFGMNASAIGLMINDDLDPANPTEGWVDQGMVLQSVRSDPFNAIDPARIDTADGRAWLTYGSWWDGIKMREIDPETGMLIAGNDTLYSLASRRGRGDAIEAPSILEHEGQFYLFVSFDRCCRGLNSTYNIRVGRADAVTGPYVDRGGVPMLEGGGTLLLGDTDAYRGPGGQEAYATPEGDILVHHAYAKKSGGMAQLEIVPIRWTEDGWPEAGALP